MRTGAGDDSLVTASTLPRMAAEPDVTALDGPDPDVTAPDVAHPHHLPHPHLPDRWRWRQRIRANKHQLFVYRIVVAVLGLMCIAAGVITGPLPGPGGIPLVLLGLAIWASEFRWAHRLMMWFKGRLHWVRQLPPARKALFWVVFLCCCGLLGYLGMVLFGLPGWLPGVIHDVLGRLPGVRVRGA